MSTYDRVPVAGPEAVERVLHLHVAYPVQPNPALFGEGDPKEPMLVLQFDTRSTDGREHRRLFPLFPSEAMELGELLLERAKDARAVEEEHEES
jgi:hypothetical protein